MIYACMGCSDRCVGCHANCEKFLRESSEAESVKALIRESKKIEDGLIRSRIDAHDHFMKKRHRAAYGW